MRDLQKEPLTEGEISILKSIETIGTYTMGPGETNKEIFDKLEADGFIQSKSNGFNKEYSITEEYADAN